VYKTLFHFVVDASKAACTEPVALTQADGSNKSEATIEAWGLITDALLFMMKIAKFHETKPLFGCLFKVRT
jgi:hypothetical protein